MLFLLHKWNDPMDYSEETMRDAKFFNDHFKNYYIQMKNVFMTSDFKWSRFTDNDLKLVDTLNDAKKEIDQLLRSNLDTPSVINVLKKLTTTCFTTLTKNVNIIKSIHDYIFKILLIFGLEYETTDNLNINDELVKMVAKFRTEIRTVAKNTKISDLWKITDDIRNEMTLLGIQFTDK